MDKQDQGFNRLITAISDLDKNNDLEVVFRSDDSSVFCLDFSGTMMRKFDADSYVVSSQ